MSPVSEGVYLFYDGGLPECTEAASYLGKKGVAYTEVPSVGMAEVRLVIGPSDFAGLRAIKQAVDERAEKAR